MVPDVLQNLINKYNEAGIFLIVDELIYWFNSKRFETWCKCDDNFSGVLYYKNTLYTKTMGHLHVYKNRQFTGCMFSNIVTQSFCNYGTYAVIIDEKLWINEISTLFCYNNSMYTITPLMILKPIKYKCQIKAYKYFIYFFTGSKMLQYNTITSTWSEYQCRFYYTFKAIELFNDKFYCQKYDNSLVIYDLQKDQYSQLEILITK